MAGSGTLGNTRSRASTIDSLAVQTVYRHSKARMRYPHIFKVQAEPGGTTSISSARVISRACHASAFFPQLHRLHRTTGTNISVFSNGRSVPSLVSSRATVTIPFSTSANIAGTAADEALPVEGSTKGIILVSLRFQNGEVRPRLRPHSDMSPH